MVRSASCYCWSTAVLLGVIMKFKKMMSLIFLLVLVLVLVACGQKAYQHEEHSHAVPDKDEIERITVMQVQERLDKGLQVVFLDSRNGDNWTYADTVILGAIHVGTNQQLKQIIQELPKESFVITYFT